MAELLYNSRYFDFIDYIKKVDPNIPRSFIVSVVKQVVVKDGMVVELSFPNGITCKFT